MATKIARGTTGNADYEKSDVTLNAPFTWHIAYSGGIYTSGSPGGFAVSGRTVSVPANAPISDSYRLTIITGPAGPSTSTYDSYLFEVVCLLEVVSVDTPTWNSSTHQWDYPVTITGKGGTPPYTSLPSSSMTVSLSPGSSTNLSSSTTDSGSCFASSSTPIGPADIPPGPPIEGEGPTVDDEEDSDIFPIDYPSGGNPTCPLTSNQMKAQAQTTGTVTLSGSSKSAKNSSAYAPRTRSGVNFRFAANSVVARTNSD